MSSPYDPNDPQRQGWGGGQQQPYQGSYGAQPEPGQPPPGWGGEAPHGHPQQGQPQQGQPEHGYPGQQGQPQAPTQQPYPGQQPYGPANPAAPFGPPNPQFGPPGSFTQSGVRKKSKTPLIAALSGVVVVVLIILAVTAFIVPGFAKTQVLNAASVQDGVQKILTETYKKTDVSKVSCPTGQKVKAGNSFTCQATIAGNATNVTITITDDNGTYQVGRP